MCGRYVLDASGQTLADLLAARNEAGEVAPRYNAAPSDALPVVVQRRARTLELATWGVPRTGDQPGLVINARAETALQRPMFALAMREGRVVVPASGFYEWGPDPAADDRAASEPATGDDGEALRLFDAPALPTPEPADGRAPARHPWYFRPVDGIFRFAALRLELPDVDGVAHGAFVVLTVPANALVAPVHDRMPAIFDSSEAVERWLDPNTAATDAVALLAPYSPERMVRTRVGREVNSTRNDHPGLIEPV